MEIVAPKKNLLRLLQRCQGVADKKSTMPVLANVLLSAEDNQLQLAATDLYISVSGSLEAEVKQAGSVAVPARDMFDRVKHMPDGPIQINVANTAATTIQAVGLARRYTLHGLPGEDFPSLGSYDLSPAELFDTTRSRIAPGSGDGVIQVNHINSPTFGYFHLAGIDTAMDPPQSFTDPALVRRPHSTNNILCIHHRPAFLCFVR